MLLEPFADGLVVNLQQTPGQDDGHKEDAGGHGDVLPQRRLGMLRCPVHLHIHQRIVGDIEGIGDISQPFADGCTLRIRGLGTGAGQDNKREKNEDAQCLIEAVGNALFPADARKGQNDDDSQGAPPETALQVDGRAAGIAFGAV